MDKEFVISYYNGKHYLKLGVYFIFLLLTFLVFITPMGDIRYTFLFFSLFLPLLFFEFIYYHKILKEISKDLYKTANIICDRINDDIFDMDKYYTIQSFNHAIERGKIKDIPKDIHLDVGSYIFPKLVHSFTDYCRMFWITGSGEEKESAEAGIRRIYDDILKI